MHYLQKELYEQIRQDAIVFDFLQDAITDGIWYWDLENPENEWFSPKFWHLLGYSPDEMPHKTASWQALIHPEDLAQALENSKKHIENPHHPYDQVVRYTHRNGSTVWVRCRGLAVRNPEGKATRLLGAHTDITQTKMAEMEAKTQNALYEKVLNNQFMFIVRLDATGKIHYANQHYKNLWPQQTQRQGGDFGAHFIAPDFIHFRETLQTCLEYPDEKLTLELTTLANQELRTAVWEFCGIANEQGMVQEVLAIGYDITERKKAEKALQEHDANMLAILENTEDIISLRDKEAKLVFFNKPFERIIQALFKIDAHIGLRTLDYLPKESRTYWEGVVKKILAGQREQSQFSWDFGNGDVRYYETAHNPVWQQNQITGFAEITRDVTARTLAEQELHKTKSFLEQATQLAQLGAFELDLLTQTYHINDVGRAILEIPAGTHISFDDALAYFIKSGQYDLVTQNAIEGLSKGIAYSVESQITTFQGNTFWFRSVGVPQVKAGKLVAVYGVFQNINEEKLKTIELTETKQQLESILNEMNDVVWSVNFPEDGTQFYTPSIEKLYGYPIAAWNQKLVTWQQCVHPEDLETALAEMDRQLQAQGLFELEYRIVCADGQVKWVKNKAKYIYDENQQPIRLDGLKVDITSEKVAKDGLAKAQALMQEAEMLARLGAWEIDPETDLLQFSDVAQVILEIETPTPQTWQQTAQAFITHEVDRLKAHDVIEKLTRNGEAFDDDLEMATEKGKSLWVRVLGKAEFVKDKCVRLYGIIQDITEAKLAAIAQAEMDKLQKIITGTNAGTWEWNLQTGVAIVNQNWANITGHLLNDIEPVTIQAWKNKIHPDDYPQADQLLREHLAGKTEVYEVEFRVKHQQGHWVWVMDRGKLLSRTPEGKPLLMYGQSQDITARKTVEENLKLFQSLINYSTDAIQVATEDGRLYYINEVASRRLGIAQDQAHQYFVKDFEPLFNEEKAWIEHLAALKSNPALVIESENINQESGKKFPVEVLVKYVQIAGRGFIIASSRDVEERKQIQEKIKQSEYRLRAIYNSSLDSIVLIGVDYSIQYFNKVAANFAMRTFGKIPEIGDNYFDYLPSHWHKEFQANFSQNLAGEFIQIEKYFNRRWFQFRRFPVYDNDNRLVGIADNVRDITAAKKAQDELRRTKDVLQEISEMAKVGGYEKDFILGTDEWTSVTKAIHEVSDDFVPNMENSIAFYKEGESRQKITEAVTKALEQGEPFDVELQIITAKGNERWVRAMGKTDFVSGKCVRLYGTFQDIDQRKKAEEIIKEQKERLDLIVAGTYEGIWDLDLQKGTVYRSPVWKQMLGYADHELPNEMDVFENLLYEDDKTRVLNALNAFLRGDIRTDFALEEARLKHKDGSTRWIAIKTVAIRDQQGRAIRMAGSHSDITERKKAEEELLRLLKLTQTQNERLKNFAHIVSHNLRSHSGNIAALLDLLFESKPEIQYLDFAVMLRQSANNLLETIEHLSDVAILNTETAQPLSPIVLYPIVEKAISHVAASAISAQVEIINALQGHETVQGVAAYLDSIVLNMLTNAIKYRMEGRKSFIKLSCTFHTKYIALHIEDNGLGIDLSKHEKKLFGLYKTFHEHPDARGIGLFITKNQVEAMGGWIEVKSEVNQGTTFTIFLQQHAEN
ncbi:MAG TPA: hypothetical protein DCM08_07305 [Microscillaceae bacterium]|jgi:PAS domain S-box-containing protein|nr:hypothetical protein [Microscillaceae bacterium]